MKLYLKQEELQKNLKQTARGASILIISIGKTQERISIIFHSSPCVKDREKCGLSHSLFKLHVVSAGTLQFYLNTLKMKHLTFQGHFHYFSFFFFFFEEQVEWAHLRTTHSSGALGFLYDCERWSNDCSTLI